MPCKKTVWNIVDVAKKNIFWKTNWRSEFFLEAVTANVQVMSVREATKKFFLVVQPLRPSPPPLA